MLLEFPADPACDYLDRQYRIVELVEWTLTNIDPLLIPAQSLAALTTNLQQGRDFLHSWRAGTGPEYLHTHAREQFETLIAQSKELATLVQKVATETAEPVKESVSKAFKMVA